MNLLFLILQMIPIIIIMMQIYLIMDYIDKKQDKQDFTFNI